MRAGCWAACAAIVSALLGAASPAFAATDDGQIGVSRDGVTWGDSLTEPLFDPSMLWVPGDVEIRSFSVRNQADEEATLSIGVRAAPSWLLDAEAVEVEARVDGGDWVDVDGDDVRQLTEGGVVAGEVARVDVRVSAVWGASSNPTQAEIVPFDLLVTLTQAEAVGKGDPGEPAAPAAREPLADTGSVFGYGALWAGAILVGGGAAMIATRRRTAGEADPRG
ncbi:hypothetical protein [Microbacterium stercoris]|uniref:LPXTG cell wall anchor domain-containing protein n=1 Tax=Microbacterium stercoris TaxID=2820289 RepID=A0A939QT75_9MICO|nr:hypothetical protein [Microbacterium stercoris]MBO3665106.1 hypothetical protein [Microbacterium stercoris]